MVVLCLTLVAGSQSLKTPGTSVNIFDLAPNYVSILSGIINGIGSFTGILVPYIIGLMTPNVCIVPASYSERPHTHGILLTNTHFTLSFLVPMHRLSYANGVMFSI